MHIPPTSSAGEGRGRPRLAAERLRSHLNQPTIARYPGVFSPLVAKQATDLGFEGVYVSGAALSADLGLPDIGLITLSEVADRARATVQATELPVLVDVDTGFGGPTSVARTVIEMEDARVAGCHIEDQIVTKRCGHLDNKVLISNDEMVQKLRAAVHARRDPSFVIIARTDARSVEGLDAAIARANDYREAGADAIFPEGLVDAAEFARFCAAVDLPVMANMTEFGRSDLLGVGELEEAGVALVIHPVTTLRLAMRAVRDGLTELARDGHQRNLLDRMQTRSELYDLIDYQSYARFDEMVARFTL